MEKINREENQQQKGKDIYNLANKIFPYCRSITGEGVRQTLADLKEYIGRDGGLELKV